LPPTPLGFGAAKAPPPKIQQGKNWICTVQCQDMDEAAACAHVTEVAARMAPHATFVFFGLEKGENAAEGNSGLHAHGVITFKGNHRLNGLKKSFGNAIHWELRGGTVVEAVTYAGKPTGAVLVDGVKFTVKHGEMPVSRQVRKREARLRKWWGQHIAYLLTL